MVCYANLCGVEVGDNHSVAVVGVINVGPESFYKPSIKLTSEEITEQARRMVEEGANIIDVGARSTAPYIKFSLSIEEEKNRLVKAVKTLKKVVSIPISIDTQSSYVARPAIEAGADILNDISGFKLDRQLPLIAKEFGLPVILVAHEKNSWKGEDPVIWVKTLLKESLKIAREAGVNSKKIVIDPGIGFIRHVEYPWHLWDCHVLRNLSKLRILKAPIMAAVSRKSFIGAILNKEKPEERLFGSLASTAIAVYNGVHLVRTHDVAPTVETIKMAEVIHRKVQKREVRRALN